jgi:murein DD-endopeptidase MepM/ murein hydrolase activator NlpD
MKSIPEYYTLTIARTGKPPLVLSFANPFNSVVLAMTTLFLGAGAIGGWQMWQNYRASQEDLDRRAEEILEKVQGLEDQVDRLKARSGLREDRPQSREFGRGGPVARPLTAEELLSNAETHASQLSEELSDRVEPALENVLAAENAIPQGLPLDINTEITSDFGKRTNPFGYNQEFHDGLDFAGKTGDPVLATASGTVIEAGWGNGYGQYVALDHGNGYTTLYAHLSEISIELGDELDRGQTLGLLGSTGRSTGPHLHYSIFKNDEAIDPQPFLVRRSPAQRLPMSLLDGR